jgi:hypothetical protein
MQWALGVKRPGHEADHSPPSSAKVKNGGNITPLHSTYAILYGASLINHRDNFTYSAVYRNVVLKVMCAYKTIVTDFI